MSKHPRDATPVDVSVARAAWHHKKLLLAGILLGLGIGVALLVFLPPVYQSSAQILVVKKRPDAVTGFDSRLPGDEDYVTPAQELLKSSVIIDHAIRASNLRSLSIFADEQDDVTDAIRKGLNIIPSKNPGQTNVIKVAFRGNAPPVLAMPWDEDNNADPKTAADCQ